MNQYTPVAALEHDSHSCTRGAFFIGSLYPFDMNEITSALKIEPTYFWLQTKEWLKDVPNFPQATWGYELPGFEYETIDKPTNDILDIFLPLRNIIIPFVEKYALSTSIDVLINICESDSCSSVECVLRYETIKRIHEMGASFQITPRFRFE